jgi:hypothetical protein
MAIRHDPDFHSDVDRLLKSLEALVSKRPDKQEVKISHVADSAKKVVRSKLQEVKQIAGERLIKQGERARFAVIYLLAGVLIGLFHSVPSPRALFYTGYWSPESMIAYIFAKAVFFITLQSTVQAILIRKYLSGVGWWVLLTSVGALLGAMACLPFLSSNARPPDVYSLSITVPYIFAGAALWLRLRKQVHFAWLWPLANCAVFIFLAILSMAGDISTRNFDEPVALVFWSQILLGSAQAGALLCFKRKQAPADTGV